jgi:phage regulator Rha-like protein
MDENKIVIYQTEDGQTQIDVRLENETVWLTQAQMAELFEKDQSVIARHINNALKEGELDENSNMHFLHNSSFYPGEPYRYSARLRMKRIFLKLFASNAVRGSYSLRHHNLKEDIAKLQKKLVTNEGFWKINAIRP